MMLNADQRRAVEDLVTRVGNECVFPYFRNLGEQDVRFKKGHYDPVSVADEAAEKMLEAGLQKILPGSLFVGEENHAADPAILKKLDQKLIPVWIADPIDGTMNFVQGRPGFGVMVALVQGGELMAGWLYEVCSRTLSVAYRGEGATINNIALPQFLPKPKLTGMVGWKLYKLPEIKRMQATLPGIEFVPAKDPSIISYSRLLNGDLDFLIYRQTWPWDHLPGLALVTETGGVYERWDRQPPQFTDTHQGLVVARNEEIMERVQTEIIAPLSRSSSVLAMGQ